MAKAKHKPAPAPGDFVDALRAGDGFKDARVVMMPGETRRDALNTRKRQSPAFRWRTGTKGAPGFINDRQLAALTNYAEAFEDAGYGRVKSCLAEPTGGDGTGRAQEVQLARRQRLARFRNVVVSDCGHAPLMFTDAALFPYGAETFDDIAERTLRGSRDARRDMGHDYICAVADALAAVMAD
jgi:hypothetical protein